MEISVIDASNYFKGLLLLIRKDHKVTGAENALMARIGKRLGFEKEFCESAVQEILKNRYIEDSPPEFSSRELAMMFVRDGLALAFADSVMDYKEEKWLRSVVDKNSLSRHWFVEELVKTSNRKNDIGHLEVDELSVFHSP
ncbi:MAG: TerB family tellurite resistance protein [Bacteroidetes bacterium]|nr:TerB family tellurite resistance protein [Bacteroidota bacterium]MCL5267278.1 TerB family tellurite resistance protein [Bacteroidota bacterium]